MTSGSSESPPAIRYPPGAYAVAFEGLDGCGKTTQVKLLAERMRQEGRQVLATRQPGGTPNLDVRSVLLWSKDLCAKARHLLHAADNAQHIYDTVRPALESGEIVVMDRGPGSAYAYQGWGEDFGVQRVDLSYKWGTDGFESDLTIFLDLTVEQVQERRRLYGQTELPLDAIEERADSFHHRVYDGYCQLSDMFPWWERIPLEVHTSIEETAALVDEAVARIAVQRQEDQPEAVDLPRLAPTLHHHVDT